MTRPARAAVGAAALDLGLVTVFVLIGRASHREADGSGVLTTLWPFAAGLAVGWLLARAWRAPLAVRTALVIWPATVAVGMLLRAASAQGVQVAFVIVTAVVLAAFLLGWRAVIALVARRRTAPAGS